MGERKRYKLCNLQACPRGQPSFREVQCSKFDSVLLDKKLYTWVPVANDGEHLHPGPASLSACSPPLMSPLLGPPANPCELHCRPINEHFVEKLLDAVADGTPCYQGRPSRDLCINGICKVTWDETVLLICPFPCPS